MPDGTQLQIIMIIMGLIIGDHGNDDLPGTLVREAIVAADPIFNYAPYDNDGDCYVDSVNIIHQGTGQEASGITTDIWSHQWTLKMHITMAVVMVENI